MIRMSLRQSLAASALSAAILFSTGVSTAQAEPSVVVTIKPVHSLIASVMQGVGEPTLIVDGGASPHGFTLRPSQAEALQNADMVTWVGPSLETFLEGTIDTLASDASVLTAMEIDGLTLHSYEEDGHDDHGHDDHGHDDHGHDDHGHDDHGHDEHGHDEHGHDEHAHEEEGHDDHGHDEHAHEEEGHDDHAGHDDHDDHAGHDDHHGHDHSGDDPHIWLDPQNGIVIALAAAEMLSELDPENAETYRANAAALKTDLTALTAQLSEQLAPHHETPFIVFHDAYRYFRIRFDLEHVTPMVVNPEIAPGARRMEELREEIEHEGVTCAFAEPQFTPRVLNAVTDGTGVTIGTLDPLGAELENGPGLYAALLKYNAAAITDCLG